MDKSVQDKLKDLSPEKRKAISESSMLRKVVGGLKDCRQRDCNKVVFKKQFCSDECEAKYRHKPMPGDKKDDKVDVFDDSIYAPLKDHYCFEIETGQIASKDGEPVLFPSSESEKMKKELPEGWSIIRADKAVKRLVLANMPVPTEEVKEEPAKIIKLDLSKIR